MSDLDRLFEEKLNRLMTGVPLEEVVSDLPDDALELAPLLSLAAQTHGIQHPQMDPMAAVRLRNQVMAAATTSHSQQLERDAVPSHPRPVLAAWRFNRLSIAIALLIVIVLGLGLAVYGPLNSHYAALADISGSVQLVAANGTGANQNVPAGSHIYQGQRLITAPGSTATLVFFDGSRMVIGPSSEIILTTVKGGWGNQLMVTVNQLTGSTRSSVVPSSSSEAYYSVNTPSGQASVHGATFNVDVASNGKSYFSVDRGRIQVANSISSVVVKAGQAIAAMPKQKPAAPAYSFEMNGSLLSIIDDMWSVSNLTFKITPQTVLPDQYQVGDTISVKGHIGSESILVADWIRVSKNTQTVSSFSGIVEAISSTVWQITGQPLMMNPETILGSRIKVGDPVNVSFIIQPDGRWQATSIQRLITDPEVKPTATSTSTSSETPTPLGTITPTSSESPTPTESSIPSESPSPTESPIPSESPSPTESPIPSVSPTPTESPIPSVSPSPTESPIPSESPTPTESPIPSVTPTPTESPIPSDSPTPSESPSPSESPTTQPDSTPTAPVSSPTVPAYQTTPTAPGNPTGCASSDPLQPGGVRLSQQYHVTYQEIMGWFCQGYGFSEINQAYSLSLYSGYTPADLFAMRASGMSWIHIKQLLGSKKATKAPGSAKVHQPANNPTPIKVLGLGETNK